jgi:hypothetical protein
MKIKGLPKPSVLHTACSIIIRILHFRVLYHKTVLNACSVIVIKSTKHFDDKSTLKLKPAPKYCGNQFSENSCAARLQRLCRQSLKTGTRTVVYSWTAEQKTKKVSNN